MATIEKRGKGYRIRVPRGTDEKGKRLYYEMKWIPPHGMTERKIKSEVLLAANVFEQQCRDGDITGAGDPKLKEFCVTYLDIQRDMLAPRTFESYKNVIHDLIIPNLGRFKLSELKPPHIQQFIQIVQGLPNKSGGTICAATVKRKVDILKAILTLAEKLGIIKSTPASTSRLTMPKIVTKEIEVFSIEAVRAMLDCLSHESLQFQCIIQIAIVTGARLGEIVGLKFSDIDFEHNFIHIQRSAYKVKGEPVGVKAPKSYKVRRVSVYSEVIDLIRLLQEEKAQQRRRLGTAWEGGENDWLFTTETGSIMNPQTPSKQFAKFLKKYNLPHRKFHALRHTSATLLLYGGINIRDVQRQLGHGSGRTTEIYTHSLAAYMAQPANAMHSMLIGDQPNINAYDLEDMRRAE